MGLKISADFPILFKVPNCDGSIVVAYGYICEFMKLKGNEWGVEKRTRDDNLSSGVASDDTHFGQNFEPSQSPSFGVRPQQDAVSVVGHSV